MDNVDVVKGFLRGQNLEQVGLVDEAVELYEEAVAAQFDAGGPYDRLIAIYSGLARHADVVRVATAALEWVRTHPDKVAWYERIRSDAARAARAVPPAAPKSRDK